MLRLVGFQLSVLCFFIVIFMCSSTLYDTSKDPRMSSKENTSNNTASRIRRNAVKCPDVIESMTFSDLDYALLGYNIMKGFPLHDGHDPGFTYPIFVANYTKRLKSADCRYSVPDGLVVIPDVSCTTSFSSRIIETKTELQIGLAMAFEVSGKVPVKTATVGFGASAGFQMMLSLISGGKQIMILSSADCRYYYSKLNLYSPPDFSSDFLRWIKRLDNSDDSDLYMDFLDYFGTHFPIEIIFGARYLYKYQMESTVYKREVQIGVNIARSASISSKMKGYKASGKASLKASFRYANSNFLSKVTVSRVTTGSPPPANDDALTWASVVKQNPVPVKYKLKTIDKLFSPEYMNAINVNYKHIAENIRNFMPRYCRFLQAKGHLDMCRSDLENLSLQSTKLAGKFTVGNQLLLSECIEHCKDLSDCSAISFCKTCSKNACRFFSKSTPLVFSFFDESWTSFIVLDNINAMLKVHKTKITGIQREESKGRANSKLECAMRCYDDEHCTAFTYCFCPERSSNCQLFSQNRINHFHKEESSSSYVLSMYIRNITREEAKIKFANSFNEMIVESTRLSHASMARRENSLQSCLTFCLNKDDCTALSFSQKTKSCEIFTGSETDGGMALPDKRYVTIFLRSNIQDKYEFQETSISGGRHPDDVAVVNSKVNCSLKCLENPSCAAVTFNTCSDEEVKCSLYFDDNIVSFKKTPGSVSVVLGKSTVKTKQIETANRIFLDSTRLIGKTQIIHHRTFQACKKECAKRKECTVIIYPKNHRHCYIFTGKIKGTGRTEGNWKTIFYRNKNNKLVHLTDTDIDMNCNLQNGYKTKTSSECFRKCLDQPDCVAISFSKCSYDTKNCKIFQEENIQKFKKKTRTDTYILPRSKSKSLNQIVSQNMLLKSTRLWGHDYETKVKNYHLCETECMNNLDCVAVSYRHKKCQHFYGNLTSGGTQERHWQSTIFPDKLKTDLMFHGTALNPDCAYTSKANDLVTCSNQCRNVIGCVAVTYEQGTCKIFEHDSISKLVSKPGTKLAIIYKERS